MRIIAISIMLLVCITGIWAIGMSGERYATDGLEYYQRGDYRNAIEMFKAADQAASGTKPEYMFWLGRLHIAMQDTTNARVWFDKYTQTQDAIYAPQVSEYMYILNRQSLIFSSSSTSELPHYLNSRNSDYGAVITPDGKYVYFTSFRPAKYEKENIWRAERLNNNWGKPFPVDELCTDKNEAIGSFSSDGKTAYLFGNFARGKIDGDIYTSELTTSADGTPRWSAPANLSAVNSTQVDAQPYVFEDKWMFFTSSRAGGMGGTDIYVSVKEDGTWQTPINLGSAVNTADNEQTPYLDWDGETLFFASNGYPGFGGYDLFKVVKIGESWTDWSYPENLGLPVNSVKNDRYYFHQKTSNEAFISTDRYAEGFENILFAHVVYAPAEHLIVDKQTGDRRTVFTIYPLTADTTKVAEKPKKIRHTGKVTDDKGNPKIADIEFNYTLDEIKYKDTVRSDINGIYDLSLPYAPIYNIVVNEEGYFLYSQDWTPPDSTEVINQDIMLSPMLVKKVFVFNNIQFAFDSSILLEASYPILNEIALTLINNPEIKIEISGHTCNMGPAKYNMWLSDRRANSIVNYLISKGIEKERLTSKGFGLTKPIASNKTMAGRILNRRVEVKVVE